MGLSQPVRRTLNHTREYKCCGYDREDGLFDIEVEMTDVKPYSFDNHDRGLCRRTSHCITCTCG